MGDTPNGPRFDAFLSYSQTDEAIAVAFQVQMSRLMRRPFRRRHLAVFRDKTSLQPGSSLSARLEGALDASEWLIVLLSGASASSHWVSAEVRYWMSTHQGSTDRMLFVRCDESVDLRWGADGQPVSPWSLPPAVAELVTGEPLYIDCAERSPEWDRRAAILATAAVLGLSPDEIAGEDLRQHRRMKAIGITGVAALTVVTALALIAGVVAGHQREIAERSRRDAEAALANSEYRRLLLAADVATTLRDKATNGLLAVEPGTAGGIPDAVMAGELFALSSRLDLPVERFSVMPYTPMSYGASQGFAISADLDRAALVAPTGRIEILDTREARVSKEIDNPGVTEVAFDSGGTRLFGAAIAGDSSVRACIIDLGHESPEGQCHDVAVPGLSGNAFESVVAVSFGEGDDTAVVVLSLGQAVLLDLRSTSRFVLLNSTPALLDFRATVSELHASFSTTANRFCLAGETSRLLDLTTLATLSAKPSATGGSCIPLDCANSGTSYWVASADAFNCIDGDVVVRTVSCSSGCTVEETGPVPIVDSMFPGGWDYTRAIEIPCSHPPCILSVRENGAVEFWSRRSDSFMAPASRSSLPLSATPVQSLDGSLRYIDGTSLVDGDTTSEPPTSLPIPADLTIRQAFQARSGVLLVVADDGVVGTVTADHRSFTSWSEAEVKDLDVGGDLVAWIADSALHVAEIAEGPDAGVRIEADSGAFCSLDVSNSGELVAAVECASDGNGSLTVFKWTSNLTYEVLATYSVPFGHVDGVSISDDGSTAAVSSFGVLGLLHGSRVEVVPAFTLPSQVTNEFVPSQFRLSPDGKWLVSLENIRGLRLWSIDDGQVRLAGRMGTDLDWTTLAAVTFSATDVGVASDTSWGKWSLSVEAAQERLCTFVLPVAGVCT
ncbi:MAG: toll/interleukin-1 receptor domain-containing protein [Acidimicrobiales bacterium]|nr:toll/interleukin-1 receptor domain-containing protein [Acidimicrobiales bacterium]